MSGESWYRLLLRAYPRAFRAEYEREMLLRRRHLVRLHAVDGGVGPLAEELDPLLLERRVALRRFDEIEEAPDRVVEPLAEHVVRDLSVGGERLVRLGEGVHVGIDAGAEVLERNAQRP